jgi:hypothetical protein
MQKNLTAASVPAAALDAAIREEYGEFGVPVDKIVSDPAIAAKFAARIQARLKRRESLDVAAVNWRLMTLRKRGEANGGLPRLEREFNGRTSKPKPR